MPSAIARRWPVVSRGHLGALCGGAIVITAAMLGGIALGSNHHTYAAYSDFADAHAAAAAGNWTPDPPAACGDMGKYSEIIYGTDGDDSIVGAVGADQVVDLKHGGNREIIMGLGGDDDLSGLSGKDCIVGGSGNDTLHGDNGKDILVGGDGDDQLFGANGPDVLDGGPGNDLCVGARGQTSMTNCERIALRQARVNQPVQPTPPATSPPTPAGDSGSSSGTPTSSASTPSDAPESGAPTTAPTSPASSESTTP